MIPAALPTAVTDPDRLRLLAATGLLDAGAETAFDRYTRLAARVIGAPVARLSLVTATGQLFVSAQGPDAELAAVRGTPIDRAICRLVVETNAPVVAADARTDPRLRDHPAVQEDGVRAYAGVPVVVRGRPLGAFCGVAADAPRPWTPEDVATLEDLAAACVAEIELRLRVAEAELAQRQLADEARHDPLTGLRNRRALMEDLEAALAGGRASRLAIFDLDGFKRYNDTFGHVAGDDLLRRLADGLARRLGDHAYRMGGDEFCALVGDDPAGEDAIAVARDALTAGGDVAVRASAGVVRFPGEEDSVVGILRIADARMYADKRAARRGAGVS